MDWLNRDGAQALKARIEQYWRERGHDVTVVLKGAGFHAAVRAARFDVRSDLVNGLPKVCKSSPARNGALNDQGSEASMSADAGDARKAEGLRERACAMADTARYNHWEDIAWALEAEGMTSASTTIGADAALRRMLNARCALAKSQKP